jgi:hypothetical protein
MDKNGYPNKLEQKGKQRNVSHRNRRFLTALDMAEIKRLESVHNAEFKRGEKPSLHTGICQCGCGMETCAFTYSR